MVEVSPIPRRFLLNRSHPHPPTDTYTQTLFSEYSVSLLDTEIEAQTGEVICLELYNKLVAFIDDHSSSISRDTV